MPYQNKFVCGKLFVFDDCGLKEKSLMTNIHVLHLVWMRLQLQNLLIILIGGGAEAGTRLTVINSFSDNCADVDT